MVDEVAEYYALNERVYRTFASFYDVVVAPLKRLRQEVADAVGALPNSRVIDIATGTGEQACAFARAGHTVVGLDISEAMLERAKRKVRGDNPFFRQGDATRLPYSNGEFDIACISLALHEMPPNVRERVLREMVRVTKPQGKLVIVDYRLPANAIASAVVYHAVKLFERDRYAEFIRADLWALLERVGVRVEQQRPAWLGIIRIVVACVPSGPSAVVPAPS